LLWRTWSFVSGLPMGALAGLVLLRAPSPLALAWCAAAGGVALVVAVSLLARWRDDETERPRHLAAASSAGWTALPAAGAVVAGFGPGAWLYLAAVLAALCVALLAGARSIGGAGGPLRWLVRALVAAVLGAIAAPLLGAAAAAARGSGVPPLPGTLRSFIFDVDAAVPTRPLPICSDAPVHTRVILDRGAHPSLSPDGSTLWFDAPVEAEQGRRQIHRLERSTGQVVCWSCGEPGNNTRPSAGDSGVSLVFESDRDASWWHPDDTNVQLATTGTVAPRPPSHQLTFSPGPDGHPVLGPGSQVVAWSRRSGGRYQVVGAAIRSGHGGVLLGQPSPLFEGGAQWVAPLAWSTDGRTLVVARGNPFAPLAAVALDPATGAALALGDDAAPAASLDADGGWLALATARGGHWAGALPAGLGFALAPWAQALARSQALRTTTGLRSGPAGADWLAGAAPSAKMLRLPEDVAAWGEPTGIALERDGSGVVIGQRRGADEERLVSVSLECAQTAAASSAAAASAR